MCVNGIKKKFCYYEMMMLAAYYYLAIKTHLISSSLAISSHVEQNHQQFKI